jgi:hypothetical protein
MMALYQQVASWQLESKLLYYFRNIDYEWSKTGNTHKIYILEALRGIEQNASLVVAKVNNEGEDRIYDTPSTKDALASKEAYVKKMSVIQQNINMYSLSLDKEPSCCERIVEDLFHLIAKDTMEPLAESVVIMQKNQKQNILLFPTAYGALVWQSSLALAQKLKSIPRATSTVSFKEFYGYYIAATYSHPNFTDGAAARRLFIVDANKSHWKEELKAQLLTLEEKDEREMLELPLSHDGKDQVTYFEWINQEHIKIGWNVKFLNSSEADVVRAKSENSGNLPQYMDFLIVPGTSGWKVVFSCDFNDKKLWNAYGLPLECCPLTLLYTDENSYDTFFDHLWDVAKPAHKWLTTEVTDKTTKKLLSYKDLVERLST